MATLGMYWWGRFGEPSGTTLTDSSGNAHDGTWTSGGAPNVVTLGATGLVSDSDTAISLPGNAAAYGTIPYGSWMNSKATISLGCVFKTTGTGAQYILNRWSDAGSSVQVMGIDLTTSNGVRVYVRTGGSNQVLSSTVTGLRDGNRHLLALDWDGATLRMYVDGAFVTSVASTGAINSPTSTDLMVGRRNPSTTTNPFNGTLDEGWFGPGLTAVQHAALWAALSTSPPTPVTAWLWAGGVTDDGFTVTGKATVPSGDVRLAVEAGPTITVPDAYGSTVAVDAAGYFTATITGLTADTQYSYALEHDGTLDTATTGLATTVPTAGAPADFSWGHASCADNNSNHRVFDAITARNPVMFQYTGDLHYADITANTQSLFAGAYDTVNGTARRVAMHEAVPVDYVWDDHDFCGDNSDRTDTAKPAAQAAYRQCVPHYSLPVSDGIYHWYMIGRVAFIVTDLRSFRDPNLDTDSPSKTCLGTTQKAWFKDTLLDAITAGAGMIVWVSSSVYNTDGLTGINYDEDSWAAYTYERTELADYIRDEGLAERVVVVVGDAHMLAYDDGALSDFATAGGAPLPQLCAAALDQSGLVRGDNWLDTNAGSGQYGVLDFTDDGTTIGWDWTGIQVNPTTGVETTIMSTSGSVDTSTPVIVAVDTAILTLSGVDPVASGSGAAAVATDPAALLLEGQNTAAAGSGDAPVAVDTAALVLTAQDAPASGTGAASAPVDPAALTLVGQAPSAVGSGAASVAADTAGLVLAGQDVGAAGSGTSSTTVDAAALALTGQTPDASGTGDAPVPASPAVLTLTGQTPVAAGTGTATQSVDVAILTLTGVNVDVAGSDITIDVDPAVLHLTGVELTASGSGSAPVVVDVATLSVVGLTPAIAGSGSAAVVADSAELVLTGIAPAVSGTGDAAAVVESAVLVLTGVEVIGVGLAPDPNPVTLTVRPVRTRVTVQPQRTRATASTPRTSTTVREQH